MAAKKVSRVPKVSKTKSVKLVKSSLSSVAKSKSKLTAEVYDINGRKKGIQALPEEIFGVKVNEKLLSQAVHIYTTNQSTHNASTKTRSETRGGGAKPWRQKGTGRARAGSRRSPIWTGGAVAHGPKPRKLNLYLPKKMKRQALICALSLKAKDAQVKIITDIEKIEPKTKIVADFLKKLETKGSALFVTSEKNQNIKLASRNLQKTSIDIAANLNAFEVIKNKNIFFTKEAIESLVSVKQS